MIALPARAYVFIGLNVTRFLSILTLLLVFSSTIVVMVGDIHAIQRGHTPPPSGDNKVSINGTEYVYECDYLESSTVPMQPAGAMFAIINHLFIIFQCVVLILSEIGWPSRFFDEYIPVLGSEHGVAILGFIQIFIGAAVLSHHVGTFALVSAFFLFAIGIVNVLLGLIFRARVKSKRSLLSWRERNNLDDGELPTHRAAARMADRVFKHEGGTFAPVSAAAASVFSNVTGASAGHHHAGGATASNRSMHTVHTAEEVVSQKPASKISRMSMTGIFGRQAREKVPDTYIKRLEPTLAKNSGLPPYRSPPKQASGSRDSLDEDDSSAVEKRRWV